MQGRISIRLAAAKIAWKTLHDLGKSQILTDEQYSALMELDSEIVKAESQIENLN